MFKRILKWIALGLRISPIRANQFVVVAGMPWASQAGYQMLEKDGTACEAAVASVKLIA